MSEKTKETIKAIAKELNYTVDKNASSLRSQTSTTLALLLFEDPSSDDSLVNPFFLSMLGSITRECGILGYDLLVSFQELDTDWHAEFRDSNKADGLILLGYGNYLDYEAKLHELVQHDTPFVRWGANTTSVSTCSIGCDNFHGGWQITEHLVGLGHKNFAFVGNVDDGAPEFLARYQGHCKALEDHKLTINPVLQADAENTEEAGYAAALALLATNKPIDAIVVASDLIAAGVLRALDHKGIAVPGDIAVTGFDDIPIARFTKPALTTCRQNAASAGVLLVDKLVELIKGNEVSNTFMKTQLVVRESCGTPKKS